MLKLSVAITTYNRYELTIKSIEQILDNPHIDDIVIYDDGSEPFHWKALIARFCLIKKVLVYANNENLGMARAKFEAVSRCKNDFVILFDSDNVLTNEYIDAIVLEDSKTPLNEGCIYMPEFARPQFDYREMSGAMIGGRFPSKHMKYPLWGTLMNTCNYVVPRQTYLEIWQENKEMIGTDTYWFNYLWLKARKRFMVVKGMQYDHLVHDGSEWMKHAQYNLQKAAEIDQLIREL